MRWPDAREPGLSWGRRPRGCTRASLAEKESQGRGGLGPFTTSPIIAIICAEMNWARLGGPTVVGAQLGPLLR